ncbi:MAG: hypothetical protein AAF297_02405, partial [Planctomycetota bacterium]
MESGKPSQPSPDDLMRSDDPLSPAKSIFVIMPFASAPDRDETALTSFFTAAIKDPIENATNLRNKYHVSRSGTTFDITEDIIRKLRSADIVVADLSGEQALFFYPGGV